MQHMQFMVVQLGIDNTLILTADAHGDGLSDSISRYNKAFTEN